MNEKGSYNVLIPIIVLAIIASIGFSFYIKNQEASDETQNSKQDTTQYDPTWKTFKGSEFDITFQYPPDWEVTTGYAQSSTFDFDCGYIAEFLKSPQDCTGTHKSPGIVVKLVPEPGNTLIHGALMLWGPTDGLGGGCPECTVKNEIVTINNTKYTIPVKVAPEDSERKSTYSTFPEGGVYVSETGANSMWSKMDLELNASDEKTYETILEIIETIKPLW